MIISEPRTSFIYLMFCYGLDAMAISFRIPQFSYNLHEFTVWSLATSKSILALGSLYHILRFYPDIPFSFFVSSIGKGHVLKRGHAVHIAYDYPRKKA